MNNSVELDEDIDILDEVSIEDETKFNSILILHNDDVNSFDWVIQSIMDICEFPLEQAEQITTMIHYKGRAKTKEGTFEKLLPMKRAFNDRGIEATIEEK